MKAQVPWVRVLAEGVVIVASILLAFGIDAWWDGQRDREDMALLLSAVTAELELNAERLANASTRHSRVTDAGFALLQLTGPDATAEAAAEAMRQVTMFWTQGQSDLVSAALDRGLQTGAFASLPDDALRDDLVRLPRAYSDLESLENRIAELVSDQIFPRLWAHVPQMDVEIANGFGGSGSLYEEFVASAPARSRFTADLTDLLADLAFENAVVERTTLLMIARDRSKSLKRHVEDVAARLMSVEE